MPDAPTVTFALSNPAEPQPAGQPAVITSGQATSLVLVLTNATGEAIPLRSVTGAASALGIYLPSMFSGTEVGQMQVTDALWPCSVDTSAPSLTLTFSGTDGTPWAAGASLTFTITDVLTDMLPAPASIPVQSVLVTLRNLAGSQVPLRVGADLQLEPPVTPPTAHRLSDVLSVTLQRGGVVYITDEGTAPIPNTLLLSLQNTGDAAIFSGTMPWKVTPTVTVTFVYGRDAAALAFDDDPDPRHPAAGSAWNIEASVRHAEENIWDTGTGGHVTPSWLLDPNPASPTIIGGTAPGDPATQIVFAFSDIVSITPSGPTRMTIAFSSFPRDDDTTYAPETFVCEIDKQVPSATIEHFGSKPENDEGITAGQPVELLWTTYGSTYPDPVQIDVLKGPNVVTDGAPSGSTTVTPEETTVYVLSLMGGAPQSIRVVVQPVTVALSVAPAGPYAYGQSVTLTSTIGHASTYALDPGLIPSRSLFGSATVETPVVLDESTTFVLSATGLGGPVTSPLALALEPVLDHGFVLATDGGIWRLDPDLSRSRLCQLDPSAVTDVRVVGGWVLWGERAADELFCMDLAGANQSSAPVAAPVRSLADNGQGMAIVLLDMGDTTLLNVLFAAPPSSPVPQFTVGMWGAPPPGGSTASPDAWSRLGVSASSDGVLFTLYVSNLATIWTCANSGMQTPPPYESPGAPEGFVSAVAATPTAVYWTEGTAPQALRLSPDGFATAVTLCEATPAGQSLTVDGSGNVFWIEDGAEGGSVLWRYDAATQQRVSTWVSDEVIYALALADGAAGTVS